MILSYHNNNHFDLLYAAKENLSSNVLYESFQDIKINQSFEKSQIKLSGTEFNNNYVKCNFINAKNLYDEIFIFLLSISK